MFIEKNVFPHFHNQNFLVSLLQYKENKRLSDSIHEYFVVLPFYADLNIYLYINVRQYFYCNTLKLQY